MSSSSSEARVALARCVGDVTRFAELHWGHTPLHLRTDDLMTDVLSVDDVDELVTSVARRPEIRLVQGGRPLDAARYCTARRIGGKVVDDVVDPAKVAERFGEGATVVLQSVHRTWPAAGRFALDLEEQLSHPVQMNAYLTPPRGSGLAPHRDGHDVLVRQLHGHKRWEVDGLGPVTLEPGDTLYLPAGTEHSAVAQDAASLHLTIGILRITYRAVVQRALAASGGIADDPLPLAWSHLDPAELADHLARAFAETSSTLSHVDPLEVAMSEQHRRRTRPHQAGTVASVVRLDALSADSVVQLRRDQRPETSPVDEQTLRVQLADRALRVPMVGRPAIEELSTGRPVRVGDLPGIDPDSRLVLARRLIAEGMVTFVANDGDRLDQTDRL
jgi:hypothetical protein